MALSSAAPLPAATVPAARLFFALWPEEALAARLADLGRQQVAAQGGRPMAEDSLHLTLAFLDEQPLSLLPALLQTGQRVAARAAWPFAFNLDQGGYWPAQGILWLGCSRPPVALPDLAASLAGELAALGLTLEARPYVPHVTLVRGARCAAATPWHPADMPAWTARNFRLLRSRRDAAGTRYETLGCWPMGGNGMLS